METRPVSKHTAPAYPTRREFLAAGAALLAAATLPGCRENAEVSTIVAPIFDHGEGRGATGCVVIAPPVFLSEEEALQIIREELARAGITLGRGMSLGEVAVEYETHSIRLSDNWLGEPPATISKPADLGAVDRNRRIGVAVVTRDICDSVRAGGVRLSVSSYDTKSIAQNVANAIRGQAKRDLRVGVFYDPLEKRNRGSAQAAAPGEGELDNSQAAYENARSMAMEKSREQLRQQAQDFVAWLEENP